MHLLSQAATFGDSLWVALNSDDSVRQLKGPTRPIYGETLRAFTLGSLRVVDGIFLFDGKNVVEEIKKFSPDVYVRAADRTLQDLDSKELQALRNVGARIEFVNFLPNFSTTRIVQHIADVVTKEP
jgi:rfaE bifunctional protein nucleotidyltransferase chain/domain